jgi:hypothetical protein
LSIERRGNNGLSIQALNRANWLLAGFSPMIAAQQNRA